MRIFRQFADLPAEARGAVVALGNFDGVHRGHRAVIGTARRIAGERGRSSAVLTFEPHPRQLFQPDEPAFRLTPFRIKATEPCSGCITCPVTPVQAGVQGSQTRCRCE